MFKNNEVTTSAVLIGRTGAGEGSVHAHLYTERLGLVRALAKSAREERSKLRPHLQVGTYGAFTLVKGAYDWRVIGASQTNIAHFACVDAVHTQFACARVLSVLRQLIHGEEPNQDLFSALWHFLFALRSFNENEIDIAERLVVVRILTSLGYVPKQYDIPYLHGHTYSASQLHDLKPFKKRLGRVINEALLASGLS